MGREEINFNVYPRTRNFRFEKRFEKELKIVFIFFFYLYMRSTFLFLSCKIIFHLLFTSSWLILSKLFFNEVTYLTRKKNWRVFESNIFLLYLPRDARF